MAKSKSIFSRLSSVPSLIWWSVVILLTAVIAGLIWWLSIHQSTIMVSGYPTDSAVKQAMDLYSANKIDEALIKYQSIVDDHPKDLVAWNGLGNVLRDLGKFPEAESAYLKVIDLNPKFEFVYRNLLTLYQMWPDDSIKSEKLKSFDGKITKAMAINKKSADILSAAATYYRLMGDTVKADQIEKDISNLPGKSFKL